MWDRVIEVFTVYGVMMGIILLMATVGSQAEKIRGELQALMFWWSVICWVPGALYVLTGFLPGN